MVEYERPLESLHQREVTEMLQGIEDLAKSEELSVWAEYPYMVAGSIRQRPIETGDGIRFSESFQPERDKKTNKELTHGVYRVTASISVRESKNVSKTEERVKKALEELIWVMAVIIPQIVSGSGAYSAKIHTNADAVERRLAKEEAAIEGLHLGYKSVGLDVLLVKRLPDNLLETAYKIYEKHFTRPLDGKAEKLLMALRWYDKGLSMPQPVDKFIAFFVAIDLLTGWFHATHEADFTDAQFEKALGEAKEYISSRFKSNDRSELKRRLQPKYPPLPIKFGKYVHSFKPNGEAKSIIAKFEPLNEKRNDILHRGQIEAISQDSQDVEEARSIAQEILRHELGIEHELLE